MSSNVAHYRPLRDWSLIMGGDVNFYPYKKGGPEKVVAMLKGDTTSFLVVFTQ